jgi:hypothetical protein
MPPPLSISCVICTDGLSMMEYKYQKQMLVTLTSVTLLDAWLASTKLINHSWIGGDSPEKSIGPKKEASTSIWGLWCHCCIVIGLALHVLLCFLWYTMEGLDSLRDLVLGSYELTQLCVGAEYFLSEVHCNPDSASMVHKKGFQNLLVWVTHRTLQPTLSGGEGTNGTKHSVGRPKPIDSILQPIC